MLEGDELLVAVRRAVALERRRPCPPEPDGLGGDLYVTTRGSSTSAGSSIVYELDAIREAVVAGDQLLLVLEDGMGLAISVDDPRLLRVEIAPRGRRRGSKSRARRWPGAGRRGRNALGLAPVAPRRLGAVPDAELVEHVADVRLHRPHRDRERGRDLAVRQAVGEHTQDVPFPLAQVLDRRIGRIV